MNYAEQDRFFRRYRRTAAFLVVVVLAMATLALWYEAANAGAHATLVAALLMAASVYGFCYLPLYLGLSVERRKRYSWSLRARWIAIAVLGVAALPALTSGRRWLLWGACVGIGVVSAAVCRAYLKRYGDEDDLPLVPAQLLVADLAILALLAGDRAAPLLPLLAGLAFALMVYIVASDERWRVFGVVLAGVFGVLIPLVPSLAAGLAPGSYEALLPLAVATSIVALMHLADAHHRRNVEETVSELSDFALVPREHALEMLAHATGLLARSWNENPPIGPDAVARWYEENSEYYLYDLAQFHLAYKHIAFMRDVLSLAEGRVLDYGAGIGDLALELARRGHEAVYIDVDGRTKAFARWRAERDWLPVEFASDLDDVEGSFDTIVSLDVFEHLLEPVPVIDALVDRLAPGGRMIVTAYFGATKAHPMHFDHDLDLARHLSGRGLQSVKSFRQRHLGSEFMRKPGVLVFEKR